MMIESVNPHLKDIIGRVEKQPELLNLLYQPEKIEIKLSDLRKRSSEFYKLETKNKSSSQRDVFWVKIVKNKSSDQIAVTLNRQYKDFKSFFNFLVTYNQKESSQAAKYFCCEPIIVIEKNNAIITKDCSGIKFDIYLKTHIPFLSSKNIIRHCQNLGYLLMLFHNHFKVQNVLPSEFKKYKDIFFETYKTCPHPNMDAITQCHRDYQPRNLFVGKGFVEVIDFVGFKKGFSEEDIIFFCRYIYKAKFNLLYSKFFKKKMIKSFLNGYGINDSSLYTFVIKTILQ